MDDHSEPTFENQLWHARNLLRAGGVSAVDNPHGAIGRICGCGTCFCCAAAKVVRDFRHRPDGNYPSEHFVQGMKAARNVRYQATGEFREPKKGEYYLSGAVVIAYRAPNDLNTEYWIAEAL